MPAKASKYSIETRKPSQIKAENVDSGVKFLKDPYLAQYSLNDFPRFKRFSGYSSKNKTGKYAMNGLNF